MSRFCLTAPRDLDNPMRSIQGGVGLFDIEDSDNLFQAYANKRVYFPMRRPHSDNQGDLG